MSEISDTAVLLQLSGQGTYYLLKGAVKGTLYLLQTYKRMHREGTLTNGEVQNFEKFIQATDGKYQILNIPTENQKELLKMKEDLNKLKVGYTVLPDLNVGDGQTQIAYAVKDAAKVENWYRSYCLDRLQPGGEKSYRDLVNLTDGQVTIVNIPWPQDKNQEKGGAVSKINMEKELLESLDQEKIPYTLLPSIKQGKKSIAVPSLDQERVSAWYENYKAVLPQADPDDIFLPDLNEYLNSGKMDEYEYVDSLAMNGKEIGLKKERNVQRKAEAGISASSRDPDEVFEQKLREHLNTMDEKKINSQHAAEKRGAESAAVTSELSSNLEKEKLNIADIPLPEYESIMLEPSVKNPSTKMENTEQPQKEENIRKKLTEIEKKNPGLRKLTREESAEKLRQDLNRLHINYTVLPDLNVGNEYIQIAFATADTPKVQAWYQAYQADIIRAGTPIDEIKEMQIKEYVDTGKAAKESPPTGKDWTDTQTGYREPKGKNKFNNFTQRTYSKDFYNALENLSNTVEHAFLSREEYLRLKEQSGIMEVTVNKSLVVSKTEDELFVSRIPGTQGREYLCVPASKVYRTDEGKTYGILMKQEDKVAIVDKNGKFLRTVKGEAIQDHYSKVREGIESAKKTKLAASAAKTAVKI